MTELVRFGALGDVLLTQRHTLAHGDDAPLLTPFGALFEEVRYRVEVRLDLGHEGDVGRAGDAGGVVAADGDEGVYAELLHVVYNLLGIPLFLVGVGTGGVEDGATFFEDVADVLDAKLLDAVGFRIEQPTPSAPDAQNLVAVVLDTFHGHGPDHTVRCWRVSASREHPNPVYLGHHF